MGFRTGRYTESEKLRKRQEYGLEVVLNPYSESTDSHIVTVLDTPVLLQAFDIPNGVTLDVWAVYGSGGEVEAPFLYKGVPLQITQANNPVLLGFAGRYRVKVSQGNSGVTCVVVPYNTYDYDGKLVEQPNGAQQQRPNLLFGPASTDAWSAVIEVGSTPLVLTAYGLSGAYTVDVFAAYKADGSVLAEYRYEGEWRQLSVDNNPIVLEQTGRYRLFMNAPIGDVLVAMHPTGTGFADPYVTRGRPGPPGPPGPSTSPLVLVAAGTIHGLRAVRAVNGQALHPSVLVDDDAVEVVGISLNAANLGGAVQVRTSGEVTENSWTWTPGYVYVGEDGVLTQTPSATGWLLVIGRAVNATTIDVDVDTAFFRG